jgi:hypothetical protein
MKLRLKLLFTVGILILPIMYGCSTENAMSPSSIEPQLSEEALAKRLPNISQKNRAIRLATAFLKSECVMQTNTEWGTNGKIVDAFPVYLDGVEDVSYYECKVQKGGADAGYILVNINQTDLPIPQYNTEGKTPSEDFAKESGISVDNLQVFRHNWFEMLAEKKTAIGLGDGIPVIARGYNKSGEFVKGNRIDRQQMKNIRKEFLLRVQQAGGVNPAYLKVMLRQVNNRDSLIAESLKQYPQGLSKSAATDRWTSDELNNTFASGWHLPRWTQITNASNQWSGCGPLALSLLYAYHRQFTGKAKLFDGLDLNANVTLPDGRIVNGSSTDASYNQVIRDVVFKIGADCHADYGTSGTGVGMNALENDGELYGDQLGYDVVLDQDYGGDWTKGKTTLGHIRGERPCMFQFYTDPPKNSSYHYGAIEGVKYMERKFVWNWYNYEMWYLVNYGWGSTRQWICVDAQYGSIGAVTEYKNTGNLYMTWR